MYKICHQSGRVLFTTDSEVTARNREQFGWKVIKVDKSREQFHEYMLERPGAVGDDIVRKLKDGEYVHIATQLRWEAWQASRAAIEIELPPVCDAHSDDIDKGYDICHYRTQECLKKQGLKFKIEGAERWSKSAAQLESK